MQINTDKLREVLALIHEDERGIYTAGNFTNLCVDLMVYGDESYSKQRSHLRNVDRCMSNILTAMKRIDWHHKMVENQEMDRFLWSYFASADIDMFHISFRSAFDHIAMLIGCICAKPGQTPASFEDLRNWLKKSPSHVEKVGSDVAKIVLECDWFGLLRSVRDSIVHNGGDTLVFPIDGPISFQVHQGWSRKILIPALMYNENVVNFEFYSAVHVCYMISFLESIASIIRGRNNIKSIGGNPKSYNFGYGPLRDWTNLLISKLETS